MNLSFIILTVQENKSCYFEFKNMIASTRLLVDVYNTISGSIQYYQLKYTILSAEVYNTITGSIQFYHRKYTICTISIQYYQWKIQYYIQCTCIYKINIIISHHKSCLLFIVYERIKVASLINLVHHKSFFFQTQVCTQINALK